MATADSVKAKLQGLIDTANNATGREDTDLSTAIRTLVQGFGSGGGGAVSGLAYDMGEFVLDTDAAMGGKIPHNLGEIPDFVVVWSDDFVDRDIATDYTDNVGYIFLRDLTGLPQRMTAALSTAYGLIVRILRTKGDTVNRILPSIPSSASYAINDAEITADTITLVTNGTSNRWRTGVTYHYFVSKAWWNLMEVTV